MWLVCIWALRSFCRRLSGPAGFFEDNVQDEKVAQVAAKWLGDRLLPFNVIKDKWFNGGFQRMSSLMFGSLGIDTQPSLMIDSEGPPAVASVESPAVEFTTNVVF